ncbi:MAG TPA: ATP-binding protein [Clostridia bacterium]|nr:ATP-binding protein [Clostridia bacterium]
MIRSLKAANAAEQMIKYPVPRTVQDTIPVQTVHEDGIFEFGGANDKMKRFSMSFQISDINYFSVSEDERSALFVSYRGIMNSLDSSAAYKVSVVSHYVNELEFETNVLLPQQNDGLAAYRNEYNGILQSKIEENSRITQDKYITVTISRKSVEEARSFFQRVSAELKAQFLDKMKVEVVPLNANERLRLLHDFYRAGEEVFYHFDLRESARRGHTFRDYICPDGMEIKSDYIRIGDRWARALYLANYATYLYDDLVAKLTDINKQMMVSVDYIPVPTQEAVQEVQRVLLGINTNIVNYNKRQAQDQTFAAIPFAMQQQKDETTAFMQALTEKDERWIFGLLTLVHVADTKEELDADTESMMTIAREKMCQFAKPFFRQLEAMQTAIPYGVRRLTDVRTMTSSSAASFIPFRSPRLMDKGGIYYGSNPLTKEMILADRKQLINGNGFVFGKAGGGKSFLTKEELAAVVLGTNDDVIVLDPEREYGGLVKALGGEVIRISATSANHINAMDINADYGEDANPVISKTEFVLSLCAEILGGLEGKERSLLDRCTGRVLRKYVAADYTGSAPTLSDLHADLVKQPEMEAKDIALRLEVFVNGSLDTFSKPTNVKTDGRLICFDLKDLGGQLKTLGMLIVLDCIINRVSKNRAQGKYTRVYIDEFHVFTANEYSRKFFISFWKRARKYGGILTGITQNIGDLMRSEDTQDIISNSEFLLLLAQAPTDRDRFAEMLHLSSEQVKYINEARVGRGLIKCGNAILPFENVFPKNTALYKLMTTKLSEQ